MPARLMLSIPPAMARLISPDLMARAAEATASIPEPQSRLTVAPGTLPGAGGYREHDILLITEDGNENITGYPYGPKFNDVG